MMTFFFIAMAVLTCVFAIALIACCMGCETIGIGGLCVWGAGSALLMAVMLIGEAVTAYRDSVDPPAGRVIAKSHHEAYETTSVVMANGVAAPITNYHPESWSLTVNDDGEARYVWVNQAGYDAYEEGDKYP